MPLGSDAVVIIEYTELDGNYIMSKKKVNPARNMAPAGEVIVKETIVLK